MQVKVVAWNVHQRSVSGNWPTLRSDPELADADVYLLSEATRFEQAGEQGLVVQGNGSTKGIGCPCDDPDACEKRRYSTAIAVPDGRVQLANLPGTVPTRPGTWTAASAEIDDVTITAIALYGLDDHDGDYAASVRRSFEEIKPILGHSEYLVLGGDFNILAARAPSKGPSDPVPILLSEIEAEGLVDCLNEGLPEGRYEDPSRRTDMDRCVCGSGERCRHTRTHYHAARPDIPYQNDYLFASKALADKLVSCHAPLVNADSPSDHAPVIAVFDV